MGQVSASSSRTRPGGWSRPSAWLPPSWARLGLMRTSGGRCRGLADSACGCHGTAGQGVRSLALAATALICWQSHSALAGQRTVPSMSSTRPRRSGAASHNGSRRAAPPAGWPGPWSGHRSTAATRRPGIGQPALPQRAVDHHLVDRPGQDRAFLLQARGDAQGLLAVIESKIAWGHAVLLETVLGPLGLGRILEQDGQVAGGGGMPGTQGPVGGLLGRPVVRLGHQPSPPTRSKRVVPWPDRRSDRRPAHAGVPTRQLQQRHAVVQMASSPVVHRLPQWVHVGAGSPLARQSGGARARVWRPVHPVISPEDPAPLDEVPRLASSTLAATLLRRRGSGRRQGRARSPARPGPPHS
jgi:hypothetical protein